MSFKLSKQSEFESKAHSTESLKFFSTVACDVKTNDYRSLNPYFVTGFTDAEGCFIISIIKDSKMTLGWRVKVLFKINLHIKDLKLLQEIKSFFEVGNINKI